MSIFGSFKDKITQYIEVYIKLFKLNFMGSTARLLSYFMFAMICMFIVFIAMLLMGMGIVEIFVVIGLSKVGAYFATMGIYVLILLMAIGLRKKITTFFAGAFLSVLTEDVDDEVEDNKKGNPKVN